MRPRNRRQSAILATIVVLGIILLFTPSSAVPISNPSDVLSNDVHLQTNGDGNHAYLDEDDELVIDLSASNPNVDGDGVNANGVTTISDVFTITYNGSEYAHVWIEYDHDAVTFTANGQSIHNESNNVTLAPGAESVGVGLRIDTTQNLSDTGVITEDDFTIHAKVAEPPEESGTSSASTSSSVDTTSTIVSSPETNERSVTVSNLQPGTNERIELDEMTVSDGVALDGLDVERASFGDVDLSLEGSPGAPEPGTELRAATGDEPLGYVAVESEQANDEIEAATFTFTIDRDDLAAHGAEPEDLRVYRHDGSSYSAIETDVVETTGDSVRIAATSPGFSVFAVAIRGPTFTVTDASLSSTTIETGESTTVTATVENSGGADGETTVRLLANGEPVGSETITVEDGGTETVTFEVAFDIPGEYDLAVENATAGTLSVTETEEGQSTETTTATGTPETGPTTTDAEPATGTTPTTDTETTPVREPSGFGFAELLGVVSLLAIVLLTLTLVRRVPRR